MSILTNPAASPPRCFVLDEMSRIPNGKYVPLYRPATSDGEPNSLAMIAITVTACVMIILGATVVAPLLTPIVSTGTLYLIMAGWTGATVALAGSVGYLLSRKPPEKTEG